jgi:uncharacterized protein YbjT (DUF2867 family)
MKRILVTGATGNVGEQVIRFLYENGTKNQIVAGVRNITKPKKELARFEELDYTLFDMANPQSFKPSLEGIDTLFLIRPPQISEIKRYFIPLMTSLKDSTVREIVFLSVQGAEKSMIIPHNRIEKLIRESGISFIFLRPSYFMQNLTTTLYSEIKHTRQITLPAGNARFNWVDVENIGEMAAIVLENFNDYRNRVFEITGTENLSFPEVVSRINSCLGIDIQYSSPDPVTFFLKKRQDGLKPDLILVMIMLHFLPRFQSEPRISRDFTNLTGKLTNTLDVFLARVAVFFKCS